MLKYCNEGHPSIHHSTLAFFGGVGWARGLLWGPMGPNIFARRRWGGWLRDSLRQFCFNAVQFRFESVVPNLFSKFEGNNPTICCMLCFSVRLQSLLGVFYMSRLCVDFTTIGRRGVFLQFKKLDSGQEGNKRLPGFPKTTWIFVIKLIIEVLYENCYAISVKCYGKNRAQWSSLCLSSYWNKKIEKEHEKIV